MSESDALSDDRWLLGIYDDHVVDRYTWLDGTLVDFTAIKDIEPDNWENRHCLVLRAGSGQWRDHNCNDQVRYICKKLSRE